MALASTSSPAAPRDGEQLFAAIDVGSNSFHLLVAAFNHGELRPLAVRGEKVQLAAGLSNGRLDAAAIARGLETLARFRQVLDTLNPGAVRAVGTNTLRAAKNSGEFIDPAQKMLGCPVEIVAGREEARLIYLGVAHSEADDDAARLVVDIGGGSTELIIGERFEARLLESLHMGCVGYQSKFFADGAITAGRFDLAYRAAYLELLNIREEFRALGWRDCVGSSGTYLAIAEVLRAQGDSRGTITRSGLYALRDQLVKAGRIDNLDGIAGLKAARHGVIAAGTAIACAVMDALDVGEMRASSGALREGVVYDLIGRLQHEDVRERTVSALLKRSGLPELHARRVELVVDSLFAQVAAGLGLADHHREMLRWAARLHEIGLTIAHSQFHKHGQYILEHADLPGFSREEQRIVAALVRGHRRKFPRAVIDSFPAEQVDALTHLCVLLRLAVVFKYASPLDGVPAFGFSATRGSYRLRFPDGWLDRHPLTAAELSQERDYLAPMNISLRLD